MLKALILTKLGTTIGAVALASTVIGSVVVVAQASTDSSQRTPAGSDQTSSVVLYGDSK